MYKLEMKIIHQTRVEIHAKTWTLTFTNNENLTPQSQMKTVCNACCQTCNHQTNITDKILNEKFGF